MPKLLNKKTGQVYTVTTAQLKAMEQKPHVMKAFKVTEAEMPAEVKALKAPKRKG